MENNKVGVIPFGYFVNINSSTIKSAFSVGRLNALAITKPSEAHNKVEQYGSINAVVAEFGVASEVAQYATNYFSYVSKNATAPQALTIYSYYPSGSTDTLRTGKVDDLEALKAISDGSLEFKGAQVSGLDFTAAVSWSDIAAKLKSKITSSEVSFNAVTSTIDVAVAGATYFGVGTSGTDVSGLLNGASSHGAKLISGTSAATFDEMVNDVVAINGNYYSIAATFELSEDEVLSFAKAGLASAGRYLFIANFKEATAIQQSGAYKIYNGYDGFYANYYPDASINALTQAFIAALDYESHNQSLNFIPASTYEVQVTTGDEMDALNINRLNSIYRVGGYGQEQVLYGEGKIFGDKFKNASVYVANSYLVLQLQLAALNLFLSSSFLGVRDVSSKDAITGVLSGVLSKATASSIIVKGSEPTATEAQRIIELTGDNLAVSKVRANGYILIIEPISDDDISNNRVRATIVYMANTPLNRLTIANFILGA